MLLEYTLYYKKFGIRRVNQMLNPPIFPVDYLKLPRASAYHFVSHDPEVLTPDADASIFKPYSKKIQIDHITTLTSDKGNPKPIAKIPKSLYGPWQLKNNRRFHYIHEPELLSFDDLTLVVYNYGLLHETYRYVEMPMSEYNEWYNIEKTRWDRVNQAAEKGRRHQFVMIDLPPMIPSIGILKMYQSKTSPILLKVFDSPERRNILELWKWSNPETRMESTMSGLESDQLKYINIVFQYHDKFCILNLGTFESWRANNELEEVNPNQPRFPTLTLQKFLLKMMMSLQASVQLEDVPPPEEAESILPREEPDELEDTNDPEESIHPPENPDVIEIVSDVTSQVAKTPALKAAEVSDKDLEQAMVSSNIADITKDIDDDLEVLERMNTSMYAEDETKEISEAKELSSEDLIPQPSEVQSIKDELFIKKDPYESLKKEIDKQAEEGVITASVYRSLLKQLESTQSLKSPQDPSKTLKEYIQIPQEDLVINQEAITIPEAKGVVDSSMLRSSLKQFTKQYTQKVLPKDIAANVHHLVNAGFLVKNYEIESESSALGQYQTHRVTIKPIDGAESTIYFRVPTINEEGELFAAGNKYRMRQQRGD